MSPLLGQSGEGGLTSTEAVAQVTRAASAGTLGARNRKLHVGHFALHWNGREVA